MAESNSFMAGKLRIPDSPKSVDKVTPSTDEKIKKPKSEPEKPWIGQSSIRELEKRNAERLKIDSDKGLVPEVPKVHRVPELPEVHKVPNVPPVAHESDRLPIAPIRDFHRVSNSINREALEGGMFTRPSCKQVYDALYLLTRGAIQPSRTIQIGRKQLQKKAGIGSDKTLDAAVISLQAVGLLKVNVAFGSQKGNIYEVVLPEEITIDTTPNKQQIPSSTIGTIGTKSTDSTLGHKTPNVPSVVSTYGTKGQILEEIDTYEVTNTKSNTKNIKNDDDARAYEAFLLMAKRLDAAVEKITGKKSSRNDAEKWETFAELLVLELQVAVSRTEGISSVPAFLTEVLRRQFFASRQQKSSAKSFKSKTDTVGKSESGEYEIKPLDKEGREAALEQLQEFAGDEMLQSFEKWYTPEDWQWLMKELEK